LGWLLSLVVRAPVGCEVGFVFYVFTNALVLQHQFHKDLKAIVGQKNDIWMAKSNGNYQGFHSIKLSERGKNLCLAIMRGTEDILPKGYKDGDDTDGIFLGIISVIFCSLMGCDEKNHIVLIIENQMYSVDHISELIGLLYLGGLFILNCCSR
jgi:hypothetical protein